MNFIEGTVTISLETLDNLRECETLYRGIRNTASGLIERIDSEQYDEKCKEIDAMKEIISTMRNVRYIAGHMQGILYFSDNSKTGRAGIEQEERGWRQDSASWTH